jgi:DNA-binding transcriptional MerR regulator
MLAYTSGTLFSAGPNPADTMSDELLTVQDAAERLGVTPRTLKYYEERGLVVPSRSKGRYRLYGADDLERFGRVLRLRSLGFSLHGIVEMLKRPLEKTEAGQNRYSPESLVDIKNGLRQQLDAIDTRIESVRRELEEAQAVRAELRLDLDYVEARIAGESADVLLERQSKARAKSGSKK